MGGTKTCSNGPGHMTKMAAMPYMIKSFKNLIAGNLVLQYYQICSSDAPGLTLTYFTARSISVPCAFVWEKIKTNTEFNDLRKLFV